MIDATALSVQLANGVISPSDMARELHKLVVAQGGDVPTTIDGLRQHAEGLQRAADLWKAVVGGLEAIEDAKLPLGQHIAKNIREHLQRFPEDAPGPEIKDI